MQTQQQWDILRLSLRELSDYDFQKKLWSGGIEGRMSTFDECICGVFDDSGLSRELEKGEFDSDLDPSIFQAAKRLDELYLKLPKIENDVDLIELHEMAIVRKAAEILLDLVEEFRGP
jgi:hypothetical protein